MKVLFLTEFDFIKNNKDGGGLCAARNYKLLCTLYGENNVVICMLTPDARKNSEKEHYIKINNNIFARYMNYIMLRDRISKKNEKNIVTYILEQNPDLLFFDGSVFGQIIKYPEIRKLDNIVFFHNIERQYTWEQVKKHSKLCIFRYFQTVVNERKMAKYGNKIICLNKRDESLLTKFYNRKADLIMPVTFDDIYDSVRDQEKRDDIDLLYVGSYYAHNYTGLIWFIENVMPYIDRHLTIIGKNMEKLSDKINKTDRINILGTVDDLSTYYLSANAIVMPIFMGGGMKLKTAEAMMYGKTIFASDEALEGYDVENIDGIFRCNTSEEFIRTIKSKLDNNYCSYNENIRKLFLEKYETTVLHKIVDGLFPK